MDISKQIDSSLRRIEKTPAYSQWLGERTPQEDDLLIVNNSHVFRHRTETQKSRHYVAARYGKNGRLRFPAQIATLDRKQNVDFRLVSHKALPLLTTTEAAVKEQKQSLGELLFALIATVEDDQPVSVSIEGHCVTRVTWDPTARAQATVTGSEVTLRSVDDEESVWGRINEQLEDQGAVVKPGLRDSLASALDELQGRACSSLHLPDKSTSLRSGVMSDMVKALSVARRDYARVLEQHAKARTDRSRGALFNEVLRLAYGFAQESTTILRLVVSICDLKPLVLWPTLCAHCKLSEAMRNLPWSRSSKQKPSLQSYLDTIGNARNAAFHNVLPFSKALNYKLPSGALRGVELQLFSEFGSKNSNALKYDDKQLVEVMLGFTRARRRPVAPSFWEKNLDVMDGMISLFKATGALLRAIHSTS